MTRFPKRVREPGSRGKMQQSAWARGREHKASAAQLAHIHCYGHGRTSARSLAHASDIRQITPLHTHSQCHSSPAGLDAMAELVEKTKEALEKSKTDIEQMRADLPLGRQPKPRDALAQPSQSLARQAACACAKRVHAKQASKAGKPAEHAGRQRAHRVLAHVSGPHGQMLPGSGFPLVDREQPHRR